MKRESSVLPQGIDWEEIKDFFENTQFLHKYTFLKEDWVQAAVLEGMPLSQVSLQVLGCLQQDVLFFYEDETGEFGKFHQYFFEKYAELGKGLLQPMNCHYCLLKDEKSDKMVEPPFYKDIAGELFSYYRDNSAKHKFLEKVWQDFPQVAKEDSEALYEFLNKVEKDCFAICDSMAFMIYNSHCCPVGENKERIEARIINVCSKKYPWIREKEFKSILSMCIYLLLR